MKKMKIRKTVLASMFLGIGMILPFFTGQIQQIGSMLLPMHIPVFLCSFICGWEYGVLIGVILPILRSLLFTMPHMYPNAVSMSFELAAYGFTAGYLYKHSLKKSVGTVYASLIAAMFAGRAVWAVVQTVILGIGGFTFEAFIAGGFLNAVPGIILQLILIPAIMAALKKKRLVPLEIERECDV